MTVSISLIYVRFAVLLSFPIASVGVTIVFEQEVYTVGESTMTFNVCAVLTGNTSRPISVNILSMNGTAQGNETCSLLCM